MAYRSKKGRSFKSRGRKSYSKRGSSRRSGGARTQTVRLVIEQPSASPLGLSAVQGLIPSPAKKQATF